MKTSDLTGAALDWAVAKCEGIELESGYGVQETSGYYNRLLVDGRMSKGQSMLVRYIPSTDWAQGGKLIEKEMVSLEWTGEDWMAYIWHDREYFGPTPLVAAMRCYVDHVIGDEVDIPEGVQA